jgi:hypothetical protein
MDKNGTTARSPPKMDEQIAYANNQNNKYYRKETNHETTLHQ